jgi:histidinol-phosphatase
LRAHLGRAFPDHGIVGEEEGADRADASHVWWVDPIDGTKSFVRGVPLYGVLVGLAIEGRVEVGVAHFPALGETVSAASGHGTRLDGRPVRVRDGARWPTPTSASPTPGSFARHGRAAAWSRGCRRPPPSRRAGATPTATRWSPAAGSS